MLSLLVYMAFWWVIGVLFFAFVLLIALFEMCVKDWKNMKPFLIGVFWELMGRKPKP